MFCVSFLIVTIAGWGNRRKKEKNGRQKDKDDDLVDKWASNDAIDDDNDDDDYEYGVDVDYDDDDDVKGDKHWIKKPKCPEIKIGESCNWTEMIFFPIIKVECSASPL